MSAEAIRGLRGERWRWWAEGDMMDADVVEDVVVDLMMAALAPEQKQLLR